MKQPLVKLLIIIPALLVACSKNVDDSSNPPTTNTDSVALTPLTQDWKKAIHLMKDFSNRHTSFP